MDVALCCYKGDGLVEIGWSLGGLRLGVADVHRQACSSHHQICYLDLYLILRRVRWPPESGCEKSRGQIESLLGHQTCGKRLIIPPMCIDSCLQPKKITQVHHKVPKNALKVRGGSLSSSNSGKLSHGFVSEWNQISFSLKFASGSLLGISSNLGELYFSQT